MRLFIKTCQFCKPEIAGWYIKGRVTVTFKRNQCIRNNEALLFPCVSLIVFFDVTALRRAKVKHTKHTYSPQLGLYHVILNRLFYFQTNPINTKH